MSSRNNDAGATVQVVSSAPEKAWTPCVGEEAYAVLQKVPEESRLSVEKEALGILARSIPPTVNRGQSTGLVVGYVQSGKTLSFTTVSALAHDNRYRMVIVITGISTNLFHQSHERLRADLRLGRVNRSWKPYRSDTLNDPDQQSIKAALERWRDPHVSEEDKATVLITVMKNSRHLDRLIKLLEKLRLSDIPTLVIDDEADQAGLNNDVQSGDESPTYRRLVRIRQLLPHHTFLQYTATPQAPLLINLIDVLSPDFAEVLTPGPTYTGGRVFFGDDGHTGLIRAIPPSEIPTKENVLLSPPKSLLEALRVFFLGVATGMLSTDPDAPANRSMMVHPSQRTTQHEDYYRWVKRIMSLWVGVLERSDDDRDRIQLLQEFETAYADLAITAEELLPFASLVPVLPRAIRETIPYEVNTRGGRGTPAINWEREYSHVLVGGQALDRGYTVEGLTVTYMPRGKGVGNADTIQQRARWFGYKAGYLGYCRIYIADETLKAYKGYVEHEEHVRRQLRKHKETGKPLSEWRRAFFLSPDMRPTRASVLSLDYVRGNFKNRWFEPKAPHASEGAIQNNRSVVDSFVSSVSFVSDAGDERRQAHHRHLVATDLPLRTVYDELLTRLINADANESSRLTGVLLQIEQYLEDNKGASCSVYRMSPDVKRTRGTDADGYRLLQLFQGAYPVEGRNKIYPGDKAVRHPSEVTVQIHRLDIYKGPVSEGELLYADVPTVAIWVPAKLSRAWIAQEPQES